MHAAKDGVGAGLQGKVGMAGEASSAVFGHESDEVGVPIHGLDGTQAEARQVGLVEDLRGRARPECAAWLRRAAIEVAAPAAEVDSGENKFVAASGDEAADVARIDSAERLRELPRVCGMTQKEQRLEQPSWILRLGRVWVPGMTGASSRKEWAKVSSARISG